jgi:ubiquinone/menaquinone biosynthesis C-methylase UbiE
MHPDFRSSQIVLCDVCGFMWTDPMPSEDELARIYESEYSQGRNRQPSDTYHRQAGWRAEAQKAFILEHGGVSLSQSRILDIGCSSGSLLRLFSDMTENLVGVEPDVAMAEAARARLPAGAEIVVDIFRPEQYPDQSFDLVTASHVLEHVPDPINFLSEMLRITRPNGAVFIEVPQDTPRTVRDLTRTDHRGALHLLYFQVETLRQASLKAGGKAAKISSFGIDLRFQSAFPARRAWSRELAWYAYRVYYGSPFKIASNRLRGVLGIPIPPPVGTQPDRWIKHSISKDQGTHGIYIRAIFKP